MISLENVLEALTIALLKQLSTIVRPSAIKNKTLFHYTDFNGLKGIIENQNFFATNSSFLNDKKEYSYGIDIFINSAEKIKSSSRSNIERRLINDFIELIKHKNISTHYVTSFSSKGDLLSQWRAYANNGKGISIGFDAVKLNNSFKDKTESFFVQYNNQENTANELLKKSIDFYLKNKKSIEAIKGINTSDFYKIASSQILEIIDDYIGLFKDKAFAEEKEYRFELIIDKEINKNRSLLFRSGKNNLLTPYLKLMTAYKEEHDILKENNSTSKDIDELNKKYKIKLLPINQIIIGPSLDFELNKKAIELLLFTNNYNFNKIKILESKVPYRI